MLFCQIISLLYKIVFTCITYYMFPTQTPSVPPLPPAQSVESVDPKAQNPSFQETLNLIGVKNGAVAVLENGYNNGETYPNCHGKIYNLTSGHFYLSTATHCGIDLKKLGFVVSPSYLDISYANKQTGKPLKVKTPDDFVLVNVGNNYDKYGNINPSDGSDIGFFVSISDLPEFLEHLLSKAQNMLTLEEARVLISQTIKIGRTPAISTETTRNIEIETGYGQDLYKTPPGTPFAVTSRGLVYYFTEQDQEKHITFGASGSGGNAYLGINGEKIDTVLTGGAKWTDFLNSTKKDKSDLFHGLISYGKLVLDDEQKKLLFSEILNQNTSSSLFYQEFGNYLSGNQKPSSNSRRTDLWLEVSRQLSTLNIGYDSLYTLEVNSSLIIKLRKMIKAYELTPRRQAIYDKLTPDQKRAIWSIAGNSAVILNGMLDSLGRFK